MDVWLDELLGNIFASSENVCNLRSRKERERLYEIIANAIEFDARSGLVSREDGCRRVVATVVRHHRTEREGSPQRCRFAKSHLVLHPLLRLAFACRLPDSHLISDLLAEVYHCDGTFERLFAGAIFGVRASYLTSNWKSDFVDRDENVRAVAFFLEHSTRARATFGAARLRLADVPMTHANSVPCEAAASVSNRPMLELLTRFGAGVAAPRRDSRPPGLAALCKRKIRFLLWTNWELPFGVDKLPLPADLADYLNE